MNTLSLQQAIEAFLTRIMNDINQEYDQKKHNPKNYKPC
jgi:hypothetical protein